MMYDYETTELIKIFQLFGKFRNSLSEKNNAFTKTQLAKKYDTVTKTFELGNKRLAAVAEHLGIKMKNAHDALCDIKTAQEVSKILIENGVSL